MGLCDNQSEDSGMRREHVGPMHDLHHGNASEKYDKWPAPDLIVSDGAYGVRGFRGDTTDVSGLVEWYKPHVLAWAKAAKPSTSLWFWNTEVGWATVHPLLLATGWEYVQLAVWNKGLAHIIRHWDSSLLLRIISHQTRSII